MGRNSRKAHLIGGLAMGGKTSSNLVEHIQAPVLLIHGEKDRTATLEQGQRLCAKLRSAGKNCELLIIPGAGHVFNFRDEEKGQIAWEKTWQFLKDHVKRPPLGATEKGKGQQ